MLLHMLNDLAEAMKALDGKKSLMHSLQTKLAVTVSSSHALWSWCMRHAAWILNRYNLHQGLTAYEVV